MGNSTSSISALSMSGEATFNLIKNRDDKYKKLDDKAFTHKILAHHGMQPNSCVLAFDYVHYLLAVGSKQVIRITNISLKYIYILCVIINIPLISYLRYKGVH